MLKSQMLWFLRLDFEVSTQLIGTAYLLSKLTQPSYIKQFSNIVGIFRKRNLLVKPVKYYTCSLLRIELNWKCNFF